MKPLLPCLLLSALVLAGCAGGGGGGGGDGGIAPPGDVEDVQATATTGGIHGFVVDEKITPIKDADVVVNPGEKKTKTNEAGAFVINDLEPGTYFVKASHPLYDMQQQSVEVVAGEADPDDMKFLLTRVILANPYMTTEKFDGYIVCSAGHASVGYSEECGEGVGTPCVNPSLPCGRVGGQGNNQVQYDFYTDNLGLQTILVELNWEPTAQTAASGQLLTYVSTKWVCDPFCGGNTFAHVGGPSPLYIRSEAENGTIGGEDFNTTEPFTVFTWANPDGEVSGAPTPTVILNQPYQVFVSKSYYLPLPEGWSLVAGDKNPF